MKKRLIIFSLSLVLLLAVACANVPAITATSAAVSPTLSRFRTTFLGVFDTVTTVIGYAENEATFNAYAAKIKERLSFYHEIFNTFDSFEGVNNLRTVNEMAGIEPVKVDPEIIAFLKQCLWANEISDGNVNVAFGAVLEIWHDHRTLGTHNPEAATLPDLDLLRAANEHTNIAYVIIDEANSTVFLKDPLMRLDVGSGSKGYATTAVANYIEAEGLTSAVLSVGGNIQAIGRRADTDTPWRIGIQNPDKTSEETTIEVLDIDGYAVVTSGVYERYYVVDGVRYHHIINPDTLFPEQTFDAVTIVSSSSGRADALTTALFNMSLEEGMALIENTDDVEALWLKDDTRYMSEGFAKYIAEE